MQPAEPHTIETAVLEDATGRRRRRMRLLGRAVSLLFLLWLVVIVLGGIGVAPVGKVPFVRALRPSHGPPPVQTLPRPKPTAPSDLLPAVPAAAVPPSGAAHARAHPPGRSSLAPAHPPGRSSLAPGHTKTTTGRGRSSLAPGHTKTTTGRGRSSSAPGHTKTTTTTTPTTTSHGRGRRP